MENKVVKNASWIIGCKIVQSILGLVVSMLSARYLGPSNYGLLNYAASIVTFVTPIMQLGLANILVNELINHSEEEGKILGTSLVLSIISAICCMIGVTTFTFIANHSEPMTILVCFLYSFILITQAIELVQYWFQSKLLSKYTSIVSLLAYIIVSIYKLYLLMTNKSIVWFAIANSLDYLIIAICLIIIYFKLGGVRFSFSKNIAKRMLSTSRYYIISSMMVTVFAQTDRIMLKIMINDSATGYYSAAVSCAGMASFIYGAIIDSARPSILSNKLHSQEHFEASTTKLYSVIIWVSLIQCVFITLFAKVVVNILYGREYLPAVSALKIIIWYTTFSYLGSVRNVWILAEQKQKWLWIINLSGAIANVLLNLFLIPMLGIDGAAIASLATQIFTNVIIGYIIPDLRNNNKLMMKGLNPKILLNLLNNLFLRRSFKTAQD